MDLLAQPLSSCRLGHRETVHFGDGSRSRQALRPVLFSQGNPIIPTRAQSRHENIVRKENLLPATTFDQPSRGQELCSETVQDPRLIKIATTHLHTNNHNAVFPIHLCSSKRLSSVNAGLESRQLGASGATTRARESENIVSGVLAPVPTIFPALPFGSPVIQDSDVGYLESLYELDPRQRVLPAIIRQCLPDSLILVSI